MLELEQQLDAIQASYKSDICFIPRPMNPDDVALLEQEIAAIRDRAREMRAPKAPKPVHTAATITERKVDPAATRREGFDAFAPSLS